MSHRGVSYVNITDRERQKETYGICSVRQSACVLNEQMVDLAGTWDA